MKMTGKAALMECLKAEGITNVYGNPGTSEGPIMEEIVRHKELRYLLTLQEGVATGMADGDARVNNKASFLSLHIDSGLLNGFSLMNDAYVTGTPMVVTSATYDKRNLRNRDLLEMARPFTKWTAEAVLPDPVKGSQELPASPIKSTPSILANKSSSTSFLSLSVILLVP